MAEALKQAQRINENLTKENVELKNEIEDLKKKLSGLEKRNELEYNQKEKKAENYYDIIININSVKDIKSGWEIKWTDENSKNYDKLKKSNSLIVGVIGNSNKGKSFILQKLSGREIPKGVSIKTEGLSLLYSKSNFQDNNIKSDDSLMLDSAGFETPLIKNTKGEKEIDDDEIASVARDKIFTELFIQQLIVEFSDIVLIVVGILTFSEQKLLNRIKKEIIKNKKKQKKDKQIVIIHNLQNFIEKNQVEEYINEVLLNSATFSVRELRGIPSLDNNSNKGKNDQNEQGVHYIENYKSENNEISIRHVIMANEGSNAGKIYNEYAMNLLRSMVRLSTERKKMDIIKEIQKCFIEFSKEVLEYNLNSKENNQIKTLTENDMIFDENQNRIKLNNAFEITFKKLLINELGISTFANNNCDPKYCYFKCKKANKNYFIVKVELPGKFQNLAGTCRNLNEYTLFEISGEKLKDDDDCNNKIIRDIREYGKFGIILPLLSSEIHWRERKAIVDKESDKGIVTFSFEIAEDEE